MLSLKWTRVKLTSLIDSSALRTQADQLLTGLHHSGKCQFEIPTDRFLLWELKQINCLWIYTPIKWQFEIPTDRFLLCDLRQIKWQIMYTYACTGILWLRVELTWVQLTWAHIWQTNCWQIYPPCKIAIEIPSDRFLLIELRQIKWQFRWQI